MKYKYSNRVFWCKGYYVSREQLKEDIEKYLEKGYCVLLKASKVEVTLSNSIITRTFNMNENIRQHYNRNRVTEVLVKTFL